MVQRFYISDYHYFNGRGLIHKYTENPALLEKLIDSYWHQRPLMVLCVLLNQTKTTRLKKSQVEKLDKIKEKMSPKDQLMTFNDKIYLKIHHNNIL